MVWRFLSLLLLLVLTGCHTSALHLQQQNLSASYLASTHVGSPDPRTPPNGQIVLAEWWLSSAARDRNPTLIIDVLYHDFSCAQFTFPICSRVGCESISVVGDEFKDTCGFLAYRARICTDEGEVIAEWQHQLWANLIDPKEDTNSSVEEKSRQGSVTEIPV